MIDHDDEGSLLTPTEVCEQLRVSRRTLHRLGKAGKIPEVRIGGSVRYRRTDIATLMNCGAKPARVYAPYGTVKATLGAHIERAVEHMQFGQTLFAILDHPTYAMLADSEVLSAVEQARVELDLALAVLHANLEDSVEDVIALPRPWNHASF